MEEHYHTSVGLHGVLDETGKGRMLNDARSAWFRLDIPEPLIRQSWTTVWTPGKVEIDSANKVVI